MELTVVELIWWMFMSIVKFLFVPSLMIARGASFPLTIITTTAGAFLGIQMFFHFGKFLMRHWSAWMATLRPNRPPRPTFTPGRRRLVRMRDRFGILGLLLISGLISVPISAMLAAKFYNRIPGVTAWLTLAFAAWAVVLAGLSWWAVQSF
jgi:hypothetical protein